MISEWLAAGFLSIVAVGGVSRLPGDAAAASTVDIRRQIITGLNSAFPDTPAQRREQARAFLRFYADAVIMPPADRARFQLRLKSRLSRLADAIRKDELEQDRLSASEAKGSPTSSRAEAAPRPASMQGGGPQDDGPALIDLIQATIAPQSWDTNGGPGTIKYWPAWHVLVVRQTDDVHEQIGGAVRGLRK